MKILISLLAVILVGACAGSREILVVKQFQLRDQETSTNDDPMVRMEKARRLHGAVSMAERRERLGQYYTILWNDSAGVNKGEVEVVFQYQQGATASRVKRMVRKFPAADAGGKVELAVIGSDYFKNGKVLAWRAGVWRGGREIASSRSYLWQ